MLNYPDYSQLAHAYGGPVATGTLKASPEDFKVSEILSFEPSGAGEHCLVKIRKRNLNTADVAKLLASHADLPASKVSWAGLKDKHAVTEQWFGVYLSSQPEPDWSDLDNDQLEILEVARHQKKLKIGALIGNQFGIRVTDSIGDKTEIKNRLEQIKTHGHPNYFGEQRFGHNGNNLKYALDMFNNPKRRIKRHQRGLNISAVRAFLFNAVLDQRIREGTWNQCIDGELCMLNGTHSLFSAGSDPEIDERMSSGDIHPTGPLFGVPGKTNVTGDCLDLENEVLGLYEELTNGLNAVKAKADRRALRAIPENFDYEINDNVIKLSFTLPTGCYATSALRELIR